LQHIYTADATSAHFQQRGIMSGSYELWLFPIVIQGEGGPVVKNVEVKVSGSVVYKQAGPLALAHLLLPAKRCGQPYTLTMRRPAAADVSAGLQRVKAGSPREAVFPVNAMLAGMGRKFPSDLQARGISARQEWAADVAALGKPLPARALRPRTACPISARMPISPSRFKPGAPATA